MNGEAVPPQSVPVSQLLNEVESRLRALRTLLDASPATVPGPGAVPTEALAGALMAMVPAASQGALLTALASAAAAFAEGAVVYCREGHRYVAAAGSGASGGLPECLEESDLSGPSGQDKSVRAWARKEDGPAWGPCCGVLVPVLLGDAVPIVVVAAGDRPVAVDAVRILSLFGGLMLQRQQLAARVASLEGAGAVVPVITEAAAGIPVTEGEREGLSKDEELDAWISNLEQESKRTREGGADGPDLKEEPRRPWADSDDEQEIPNLPRSFTAEGVADLRPEDLGLSAAEFERLMGKAAVDWRHSSGEIVEVVGPEAEEASLGETEPIVEDPVDAAPIDSGYGDAGSADEAISWRVAALEEAEEASPALPKDLAQSEEVPSEPAAPEPAEPVTPIPDASDEGESIRFWREADDEDRPPAPALETAGELPGIDWAALVGEAAVPAEAVPEVEPVPETAVSEEAPAAELPESAAEATHPESEVAEPGSIPVSGDLMGLSEEVTRSVEVKDWDDLPSVSAPPEIEPDLPVVPETVVQPSAVAAAPADQAVGVGGVDQNVHIEARRFARLLVAEIRLYNEQAVEEGRRQRDLYFRLKTDIDRSREMYEKRARPEVKQVADYFHEELVQSLAGGDAGMLGLDYPGSRL